MVATNFVPDTDVSFSARDIWRFTKWVWAMILPHPKFGAVSQEAGLNADRDKAWLHLNVNVGRCPVIARRDIPCCKAYIIFVSDHEFGGAELGLKWQNRDLRYGSIETTLIAGKDSRKIPLVLRQDNASHAVLTDFMWFEQAQPKRAIQVDLQRTQNKTRCLEPGKHKFIIKIVSGFWSWESPYFYTVNVPKENHSNSHFSISQEERPKKWRQVNI